MEQNNNFIDKLDYLQDLYIKSREAIALLENYNQEKDAFLGLYNEMRNALDHIMRMIGGRNKQDVIEKEFKDTESHLLRAGYDAYELICISLIQYIKVELKKYSPTDIKLGLPSYYSEIREDILKVEKQTASIREKKEHGKEMFAFYFESAERLIKHIKEIDKSTPTIDEFYNDRIKKENKAKNLTIIVAIIGTLAGIVIGIFCKKWF
jgi:hypothetical protein